MSTRPLDAARALLPLAPTTLARIEMQTHYARLAGPSPTRIEVDAFWAYVRVHPWCETVSPEPVPKRSCIVQ